MLRVQVLLIFKVLEISHINSFVFPHLLQHLLFHATFLYFLVLFVFFSSWFIGAYNTNECNLLPDYITLLLYSAYCTKRILCIDYPMINYLYRNHFTEMFFIWTGICKDFFFTLCNLLRRYFFCPSLKYNLPFWLTLRLKLCTTC